MREQLLRKVEMGERGIKTLGRKSFDTVQWNCSTHLLPMPPQKPVTKTYKLSPLPGVRLCSHGT
jgi:hypothetical protein